MGLKCRSPAGTNRPFLNPTSVRCRVWQRRLTQKERKKINMMKNSHIEWAGRCFGSAVISLKSGAALLLCAAATMTAQAGADNRAPEVPQQISVGDTNKVHFHG